MTFCFGSHQWVVFRAPQETYEYSGFTLTQCQEN
jgi:hypothetical protein